MKKIIHILFVLSVFIGIESFTCGRAVEKNTPIQINDSNKEAASIDCKQIKDSLNILKNKNDSLKTQLFLANYKINKVRFYLNICLKNPTQDKFFKGWVKRSLE